MTIPQTQLSSLNANYIASSKATASKPQNTTAEPSSKKDVFCAIKNPNNLSKAAIAFCGAAVVAGIVNIIGNRRNTKTINELSSNVNQFLGSIKGEMAQVFEKMKNELNDAPMAPDSKILQQIEDLKKEFNKLSEKINDFSSKKDGIDTEALKNLDDLKSKIIKMLEDNFKAQNNLLNENKSKTQEELQNSIASVLKDFKEVLNAQALIHGTNQKEVMEKLNAQFQNLESIEEKLKAYFSKEASSSKDSMLEIQKAIEKLKETLQKQTIEIPSKEEITKTLKDIKFNKGAAYNLDGTLFSGIISDTKNNKEIKLTYKNGQIIEAIAGDVKKTYKLTKTPKETARIITITDSSPVAKIFKILKTKKKTTMKEYRKFIKDGIETKSQSRHFEHDGKNYIRASLLDYEQKKNPILYYGTLGQKNERILSSDEMPRRFKDKAIEDDGYKCYSLFTGDDAEKKSRNVFDILNSKEANKQNNDLEIVFANPGETKGLEDLDIVDPADLEDLLKPKN